MVPLRHDYRLQCRSLNMNIKNGHTKVQQLSLILSLLLSHILTEPGPAAGEGVGILDEPAGKVAGTTSAVAVKSSLQIGEELNSSTSNRLRNLRSWMGSG